MMVTILGSAERQLRVIDTREIEATGGLHLGHGETERPREGREIVKDIVGEVGGVHLRDDVVVIRIGGVFEEGHTVDV